MYSAQEDQRTALLEALRKITPDYKAGVVAAELVDNDIPADTFFFRNRSTFKRPVSRDIEEIFWNYTDGDSDHLIFALNREGIYDMLPEALLHNQERQRKGDDSDKLGNELRRQEKDARNFFSPLENEFHHRSLNLDIIERELLKNNNQRRNREFFNYFFEDSSMLTDQQLVVLMYILPLSHKIRGNLDLIALTITKILNHKARIARRWINKTYELSGPRLKSGKLGADSILGDHFKAATQYYDVAISGVSSGDFAHFTGKGKHINVLHFILPYFFPADAEYGISLEWAASGPAEAGQGSGLNNFLGFNSYI